MDALKYEKKRYSKLDQKIVDFIERRTIARILKSLKGNNYTILDIPCGYGRFSELLLKNFSALFFCDIKKEMVLRNLFKHKIPFGIVGDIKNIPFKKNSFDIVFVVRLFQHLKKNDREKAMSELKRISRKWVFLSFYRKNIFHIIERRITGRKNGIQFLNPKNFFKRVKKMKFLIERIKIPFSLFHAQTFVLFKIKEK